MLALLSYLRITNREDFTSLVFFAVVSLIAAAFIGYLVFDGIKTFRANAERKKRHRQEREK